MDDLVDCDYGVKNLPPRDKASLLRGGDQGKNVEESWGKHLRDDFVKRVAKANRPKLVHRINSRYLWNENQESGIEFFQKISGPKEFLNCLSNIPYNHLPIDLEKEGRETVWARSFVPGKRIESLEYFL